MTFDEKLYQIRSSGEIIGIYNDRFATTKFTAGYLLEYDTDYALLGSLSPLGTYDGYILHSISSIYRIDSGGKYEAQLTILAEENKTSHAEFSEYESRNESDALIFKLLDFADKTGKIISIELNDSSYNDVTGYIDEYDEVHLSVRKINENGDPDGYALIFIDDITLLACDTDEEQRIDMLIKAKSRK